jgi:GTP-binding protein Era
VQTTRHAINGVVNFDVTQMVFTDTPGIFRARKDFTLEKRITNFAWKVVRASSVVLLMVDGFKGVTKEVYDIINDFKRRGRTLIAVITKIDRLTEKEKLDIALKLEKEEALETIFYISSIEGTGIEKLMDFLKKKAVEGEWLFDGDTISDMSENVTVAEIVREQIFLALKDEIPYHTSVQTEKFIEETEGILANALITVTKESQKIIMIGKRGEMLKKIKHGAEEELYKIFQKPIEVTLFIRVRESWREGEEYYNYLQI